MNTVPGNGQHECVVIPSSSDEEFTASMYALVPKLRAGLVVLGRGPVSPALARDAQQALRSERVTLVWLAQPQPTEFHLGIPDGLAEDELEAVYASLEAALPELLHRDVRVTVAPLPQVLALSLSGR
ncbi:MAG TPA: hypothetical protein VK139_05950 [Microbacteriaceae bacterium]|nr:hypothetical protein [Microbacteriaceae bacterium]